MGSGNVVLMCWCAWCVDHVAHGCRWGPPTAPFFLGGLDIVWHGSQSGWSSTVWIHGLQSLVDQQTKPAPESTDHTYLCIYRYSHSFGLTDFTYFNMHQQLFSPLCHSQVVVLYVTRNIWCTSVHPRQKDPDKLYFVIWGVFQIKFEWFIDTFII